MRPLGPPRRWAEGLKSAGRHPAFNFILEKDNDMSHNLLRSRIAASLGAAALITPVLLTVSPGVAKSASLGFGAFLATGPSHVCYVNAAAPPSGDGSLSHPFDSLAQVQQASGPGDTIVIEPAPLSTPPLNGGITLKPGQTLEGGGPSVLRLGAPLLSGGPAVVTSAGLTELPRITNTSNTTNNGDAVDLADNTTVKNVVIDGSYRGGIYGDNVTGAEVIGNDVSGQNTSETPGFEVLPFFLETYTPFTAIVPHPVSLLNGWAGIMVDENTGTSNVSIMGNYVHDGACGDGIDVRSMGTAEMKAEVTDNFVTRLHQCSPFQSLEGIGTQINNSASLDVRLVGNTEAYNGNTGANADSLFVNPAGTGILNELIANNAFTTGIGGASTNGLEYILSNGSATSTVDVENSTFENDPGDMLEEFDRGVGSSTTLILDHVLVEGTTISGGIPSYAQPAGIAPVPDNTGECLGIGSVGSGDQTSLIMDNSTFEGCDNNGIEVTNNHVTGDGVGNIQSIALSINHSEISGSRYYNLWVNNLTPLNRLSVRVANSNLATSQDGVAVAFDQQPTASTGVADIDLGGGPPGPAPVTPLPPRPPIPGGSSPGQNCIFGGTIFDLQATEYNVFAEHDWWGQRGGPAYGTISNSPGYTIDDGSPLEHQPPACGSAPGAA